MLGGDQQRAFGYLLETAPFDRDPTDQAQQPKICTSPDFSDAEHGVARQENRRKCGDHIDDGDQIKQEVKDEGAQHDMAVLRTAKAAVGFRSEWRHWRDPCAREPEQAAYGFAKKST